MAEKPPKIPDAIILENSNEDGTVAFDKDDIIQEIRDDSVDLLRQKIKDGNNKHQLKIGSVMFSLRTQSGKPAPLSNGNNAEEEFMETQTSEVLSKFNETSNTGIIGVEVAKGKTDRNIDDIDTLLNDVNENLGDSKIAKGVENFQKENNIYSKNKPYINPSEQVSENQSNVGHIRLQKSLGVHGPRKWPTTVDEESNIIFEINKLKNLGIQVLMNSSGEVKAAIPEDPSNPADVLKAQLASVVPGAARLGVKVPVNRFSTAEIARGIDPNFEKTSKFPELEQDAKYSYGSVNNHLVPFSAINNTSSRAAAIILSLTVSGMLKALAAILNPPKIDSKFSYDTLLKNSEEEAPINSIRKNYLGSYIDKTKKINNTGAGLGPISTLTSLGSRDIIVRTRNDFGKAVNAGLKVFFGAPEGAASNVLGAITPSGFLTNEEFEPVKQNPEYFSVLLRMLVRSTVDDVLGSVGVTAAAFGVDLGRRTPTQLDIDRTPGLDANPTNLLVLIQNLRESKLVKFLNIIAILGDIYLENFNTDSGERAENKIDAVVDILDDTKEINPAALVKKNRLSHAVSKRFQGKLAWGADTIRSMYLKPKNLFTAEKLWLSNVDSKNIENIVNSDRNYIEAEKDSKTNRLSNEMVVKIEEMLDGYYMPFYFHDLRTNEIIAFHAFIETISDAFDVEYTEGDGYGRIGKTYSYKNTNRNISISFRVVSTSPEDFDHMWLKINKLMMLLYPQYTKGRQLTYDNGKFTQPFSQLIGNSPMIRLRVGDLIKSNFSEFDLARLFGIGTESYKLDGDITTVSVGNSQISLASIVSIRNQVDRMVGYDFDVNDKFTLSQFGAEEGEDPAITFVNNDSLASSLVGKAKTAAGVVDTQNGERDRLEPLPINLKVKVSKKISSRVYILDVLEPAGSVGKIRVNFENTKHALGIDPDFEYLKNKTNTVEAFSDITNDQLQSAASSIGSPQSGGGQESLNTETFLGPENPIFKAFKSTSGQGLAGFIKSLSFDWSDSRWATEGINKRAPMWAKIDISFVPVHDINPGLDASGAPTGMLYNVGSILKQMKLNRSQLNNSQKESRNIDMTSQASTPNSKKNKGG